jgi:hypothetical protein
MPPSSRDSIFRLVGTTMQAKTVHEMTKAIFDERRKVDGSSNRR